MNRRINSKLFMICVLVIAIIGCTQHTPAAVTDHVPPDQAAPASRIAETTTTMTPKHETTSLQPLSDDVLPVLQVKAGDTTIPAVQSSYCWGTKGCADFVGGAAMLKGKSLPTIQAGTSVQLHFPYTPEPAVIELVQYPLRLSENTSNSHVQSTADQAISITIHDGAFQATQKAGDYYYEFGASWMSEDGKYSSGQTSFVFGFTVG